MSKEIYLKEYQGFVKQEDYVKAKTKQLIEFGYENLNTKEVDIEVNKILSRNKNLTIIGKFCEDDIDVDETFSIRNNS